MPYTNAVSFNFALNELDLFDDIKGIYLKQYFKKGLDLDEYDFEIEIVDIEVEDELPYMCNTQITFDLCNPDGPYPDLTFTKKYRYNNSSPYALIFVDLNMDEEDEESDEE